MCRLIKFSRDERPEGSGLVSRRIMSLSLNPYPLYYRTAFAFSLILYPHRHRRPRGLLPSRERYGLTLFHLDDLAGRVLFLRRQRCLPMTEEHGAYRTRCKGAPSIFRSTLMTTLKRICICSPCHSPLPFAAAMLAATPFPRGSGANLAVRIRYRNAL